MTERPSGSQEPAGGFTLSEPRPAEQEEPRSFLHELPILFIVALAVAIVLKTFVVQAFFIPSGSMEPTLEPGDRVLVQKVVYGPDRGDVIVFSDPQGRPGPDRGIVGGFVHWLSSTLGIERPEHEDFIKRVIGLPGETVELRDGRLFVDGVRIHEPYLKGAVDTRDYGPVKVPEAALFVLGDNRLNSNDSRFGLGFVPVDKVVGRAFAIVWPPSRVGWIH
ncbi:MAG TPA: signal peptidase I [Actinomycetota bacterium]|nr:signal peptidase I [Actinomycetota bacterium]